ncbi:MAG TPA: N-methyl-L-tryptophan oxidase [Pirellulales bacterium]|nr:N-methyl-L-tryptophan oxidase [Pirellulales bacterium]
MSSYDVIVIGGAGGVGSAALYHLAQHGVKVLGLDRFPPGHDRGSSHGRTRIIRQAYFEHSDYVPLLLRAYELWDELSQRCGKRLYHEIGLLQIGPSNGRVVPGVLESARQHGLLVDRLTARQAMARFPAFRIPDDWEAVFEQRAGYLDVEDCVLAHLSEAQILGAELQTGVQVLCWSVENGTVSVDTDAGQFHAGKLVMAAGAWAGQLLSHLGILLTVLRAPVFWYPIIDDALRADRGCPAYLFDTPQCPYGIPQVDEFGFKIAEHGNREKKQSLADPLQVNRQLDPNDQARVEGFLREHIPGVGRPHLHHSVCLYTMSPDENFIVDVHPQFPQVVFAAGLSGHGFKFTCVLGEILADLALAGRTSHPIGFLNRRRFGTV